MGFLDKLFGKDEPERMIDGLIIDHSIKTQLETYKTATIKNGKIISVQDKSKAVDAEHWDGLNEEARKALSDQEFYRDYDDDNYKIIEP